MTGNTSVSAPLLIVGAGPVGLALAGDLASRGQAVTILERSDGTIEQPRMDMVGVRTMEYCRRWGIVPNVEASAYNRDLAQDNVYVTSLTGYELSRERFPSMRASNPPEQSPQKRERCPQDMFDPILRDWARSFPSVDIRYRHQLVDFEQNAGGVVAQVLDLDAERTFDIEAPYMIGCDGAGSRIAKRIAGGMEGTPVLSQTTNIIFRAPQLLSLHDKGEAYRFIILDTTGMWCTIVAINGWDRWRMSITNTPEGGLSREDIAAAIRRAVGIDFEFEILSVTSWTRRELVAQTYGEGRVFIAGDAAHVMSPTGGFGMNTGIGDAVDLSWKLDAVQRGWGGAELLVFVHARAAAGGRAQRTRIERQPRAHALAGRKPDAVRRYARRRGLPRRTRAAVCRGDEPRMVHARHSSRLPLRRFADLLARRHARAAARSREVRARVAPRRARTARLAERRTLDARSVRRRLRPVALHGRCERGADRRGVARTERPVAGDRSVGRSCGGDRPTPQPLVLVRPDGQVAWRGGTIEDPGLLADCVRGAAPYAWKMPGELWRRA